MRRRTRNEETECVYAMIAIGEKDAYNQEEVDEHAPRPRSLMGKRELERKKKKKSHEPAVDDWNKR